MELAYLSTSMGDVGARASKRMIEKHLWVQTFQAFCKIQPVFPCVFTVSPHPKNSRQKDHPDDDDEIWALGVYPS
jgi:hypothetical protein